MSDKTEKQLHMEVMDELQKEWEKIENSVFYDNPFFTNNTGIKSTQISALVRLLIRKGILKFDEEATYE